ncbi:MAG TPA: isocitrate/isopropylmalate family dehydrogenase [Dehalococcoidia bacterium]|nr:isocitrate/isopropylmalate family dehydrogenase [Dehalococcoidia bacterium]
MTKKVCVIPGDAASPEAVLPALSVLKQMELDIDWLVLPPGEDGVAKYGDRFLEVCKEAIDSCDTTLFGSTGGKTPAIGYLRFGKDTYANVRPTRYMPGARSPLKNPEGIDFIVVRENIEDLYAGIEGELSLLAPLGFKGRVSGLPISNEEGFFAVKVITERNTRRVVHYACKLAMKRKAAGYMGKVTVSGKYNVLPKTDGYFRSIAEEVVAEYPELKYEQFITDDFARRIVATPHSLDVVVMPNLYGDILSDEAASLVGGLGVAPSGCYGDSYAYFESVHGSAPDIAGQNIINPTAVLLSAKMMLEHLAFDSDAKRLESAIEATYKDGRVLTPDQGGTAHTGEFCDAVTAHL